MQCRGGVSTKANDNQEQKRKIHPTKHHIQPNIMPVAVVTGESTPPSEIVTSSEFPRCIAEYRVQIGSRTPCQTPSVAAPPSS